MPSDGDPRAAYGVVHWDGQTWQLEHRRVSYDHESVAGEILGSETPFADVRAERIRRARFVPLGS
jgi:diadenosine tetraphosphatase ApaH/serine/threonine PP2A family protein phosphatase